MNKSKFTLKFNPNKRVDLSKLNTFKSTKTIEVMIDKLPHNKNNKAKIKGKEIKPHEPKPKKIPTTPPKKVILDFQEIYNNLHNKFPAIINMSNPVIFAIGLHKELAKEVEVSNVSIGKWISWYTRKTKYYNNYQEGAARFNLRGEQCGSITEKEVTYAISKISYRTKQKEERWEKKQ